MKYRVEVEHTRTYQAIVEADTVEDAMERAQRRVYPITVIHNRMVVTDAEEIDA